MIVALVALVAALGGTAAATRYLVSSPKQLRPGVISERLLSKAVRVKLARVGNTGNTGPTGATGPKGAQGEKGDKGDKGDQGPIGPSAGYSASRTTELALQFGSNVVTTLAVPAGSYVVTAKVEVFNGGATVNAGCSLETADGSVIIDSANASDPGRVVLPLTGAITLAAAGGFRIDCTEGSAQDLRAERASMTAVLVGALNP
jgi:hypothetical protein